jgi:hypothetical protein
MIRTAFLCLSAIAVAACQPNEDVPSGTPDEADSSIIATPEALAGEYRVAGVDGQDVDLPHGIAASITADRIEVQSDCIRFAWSYRFEDRLLVTEQAPVASCRRALLPEERALSEAIESADVVRRTPENGIELSGSGRSVTLFSQ